MDVEGLSTVGVLALEIVIRLGLFVSSPESELLEEKVLFIIFNGRFSLRRPKCVGFVGAWLELSSEESL